MQEYWEKYKKPIDGKPATVSLNVDFMNECDNYEYMYVGFVKVALREPKEDGLIAQSEIDEISQIEDRLEFEALRFRVGKYVGLITTDGSVNFIYYLKMDFEWENVVHEAMKHFPHYSYEFGSKEDMQCEVYRKLLYPDIYQWQIIHNHNTCNQLIARGDTLQQQRAIEHTSYFKDVQKAQEFLADIGSEGFTKTSVDEESGGEYGIKVNFFRKDVPFFTTIDEITLWLIGKTQQYEGVYDGWECSVVLH